MYSTWKVSELKEELKKRGASLRGRKMDLIERLEFYDQNFNFRNPDLDDDVNEDPSMVYPSTELFKDINCNTKLPPINTMHIRHYLSYTNKKMTKAMDLYESRHLVAARACTVNDSTFLKGIVRKTMKTLHYECNLKLYEFGNIIEAHCECPAGSGVSATCKHVAVLLLGVEQMVRENIILLFETCTQKLQSFHAPKNPYGGTPVRAEKMKRKKDKSGNPFEPYPLVKMDKENYNARIRNLVLNCPNSRMPLKQLYEPANTYAQHADHDYTGINQEIKVLEDTLVSKISLEEIQDIEEKTRGQISSAEWLTERKKRMTASIFHTICHLKPSTAPGYAVAITQRRPFQSRATTHGIINEPIALKKYCEQFELAVVPCGLVISKERPYLAASPDGLLGTETIIEIKCPYASRYQPINHITVPYLTPNLTLKKSSPFYYQVQGQLYCTERKFANFIIYTYKDMKVIFINRDESFISNMLSKLENFYECYFKQTLLNKYLYSNYNNFKK